MEKKSPEMEKKSPDSDDDIATYDSRPKDVIRAEKRAENHAKKVRMVIYFIFVYESGSCSILIPRTVYESEINRLFSDEDFGFR
jgi:hypothetical protein